MKAARESEQVVGVTRHSSRTNWRRASGSLALVAWDVVALVGRAGPAQGAGLLIPTGQNRSLAIESQKVDVNINNGVAVTTVTQVFKNDAPQPLEALYTFPVPREASVSNFSMWINGKEVIGEVLERERARQIYRQVTRVLVYELQRERMGINLVTSREKGEDGYCMWEREDFLCFRAKSSVKN